MWAAGQRVGEPNAGALPAGTLLRIAQPVLLAAAFLTRIPVRHHNPPRPADLQRAHAAFPVVGMVIGGALGACDGGLLRCGMPPAVAATLTLAVGALLTGALHEDGLADTCDGFGGGHGRERKLAIMRDSRIGTYGAVGLVLALLAKVAALAAVPSSSLITAMIVVHSLSRSAASCVAACVRSARPDGLGAAARPTAMTAVASACTALAIAFVALPVATAVATVLVVASLSAGVAVVAIRQIGGQTGDVLGAVQQMCETAILAILSSGLAWPA